MTLEELLASGRSPIRTTCACGKPGMRRNAEGEPLCDGCTAGVAAWLPEKPLEIGLDRTVKEPLVFTCPDSTCAICGGVERGEHCEACATAGRALCACGQTIWNWRDQYDYQCADCAGDLHGRAPLDSRIRDAQRDADPTSDWSAWAHPSGEGEKW